MNGLHILYQQSLAAKKKKPIKPAGNIYVDKWTKFTRSGFYDPRASGPFVPGVYDQQLSGIFDTVKDLIAPYKASLGAKAKEEFKEQLDKAQRQVEEKVGQFLITGQKLTDLKIRAQAQENSNKPEVRSRAVSIVAKANALLNNYNAIKSQAMTYVQSSVDLKNQIQADPIFNFAEPLKMGTRIIEAFNKYKSQVGQFLSQSAQMSARLVNHIKETDKLAGDVSSLESYAQGKGWAMLENVGSAYMGLSRTALIVAGVGLTAYFLVPRLLAKRAVG